MIGDIRVVDNVPQAYAALAAEEMRAAAHDPFRLGVSGGASGTACTAALAALGDLSWGSVVCLFADERCVDPGSEEANQTVISRALGPHLAELRAYHPVSCTEGPQAYEAVLAGYGGFDLLQLGLGPDGHTASLFPGSAALSAPPGRLVVTNEDPSGTNPYPRITLTYEAIALSETVVVTVIGSARAEVFAEIARGADLPAAAVRAGRVVWLVDHDAAAMLPEGVGS